MVLPAADRGHTDPNSAIALVCQVLYQYRGIFVADLLVADAELAAPVAPDGVQEVVLGYEGRVFGTTGYLPDQDAVSAVTRLWLDVCRHRGVRGIVPKA